jgi:hypothetical protein
VPGDAMPGCSRVKLPAQAEERVRTRWLDRSVQVTAVATRAAAFPSLHFGS